MIAVFVTQPDFSLAAQHRLLTQNYRLLTRIFSPEFFRIEFFYHIKPHLPQSHFIVRIRGDLGDSGCNKIEDRDAIITSFREEMQHFARNMSFEILNGQAARLFLRETARLDDYR